MTRAHFEEPLVVALFCLSALFNIGAFVCADPGFWVSSSDEATDAILRSIYAMRIAGWEIKRLDDRCGALSGGGIPVEGLADSWRRQRSRKPTTRRGLRVRPSHLPPTMVASSNLALPSTDVLPDFCGGEPCQTKTSQALMDLGGSADAVNVLAHDPSGLTQPTASAALATEGRMRALTNITTSTTATTQVHSIVARPPVVPPDCSFSRESPADISKANDWAKGGAGKGFECRGDWVRQYREDMAIRGTVTPPVDYFMDRGFEFPNVECGFERDATSRKCDECNTVLFDYGHSHFASPMFTEPQDESKTMGYAFLDRHQVKVRFFAPCIREAFTYRWVP